MARFRLSRRSEPFFLSTTGIGIVCVVLAAALLLLLPRDDPRIVNIRQTTLDALAVVFDGLSRPMTELRGLWRVGFELVEARDENLRLQAENADLKDSLDELARMRILLDRYRQLLSIPLDPDVQSTSARVIADVAGPFVRTIVANTGTLAGVRTGHAVMSGAGLTGRVISVGRVSSRILLVTDFNSHVPVVVGAQNVRAIMSGDNTENPVLEFLPRGGVIADGDMVVTSGDTGLIPIGLPVGRVVRRAGQRPRVILHAPPAQVDFVRILLTQPPELPPPTPALPDARGGS